MDLPPSTDSAFVPMIGLEDQKGSLDAHVVNSHGFPFMKSEDLKLSVLALQRALDDQIELNKILVERIAKLEQRTILNIRKR